MSSPDGPSRGEPAPAGAGADPFEQPAPAPAPVAAEGTAAAPASGSVTGERDPGATDRPADADGDGGDDDADEAAPGRRGRLLVIAVAVATVVLLVVAALLSVQLYRDRQQQDARQAALTSARQLALNLTSIDGEDFPGDVARILDLSTGGFREDFTARSAELEQVVEENEVASQGEVVEGSVVRSDRESATTLLVVDTTQTNKAQPEPQPRRYVMKLEVERVGSSWLVSSVDFL